jgi:excinuclease ABC subunit A
MRAIRLFGVRQNNLKGFDIELPLGAFTVICGPSGSGKSSLAFETLYAEGQRRYVESLSNYTKQFLSKMPKPELDAVENIPPALAIEQKNSVKSSRSTVGTTTEVVDYLRLLFEKIGRAHCPRHYVPLEANRPSAAAERTLKHFEGGRGFVVFPVRAEDRLLEGKKLHELLVRDGFARILTGCAVASEPKSRRAKASRVVRKVLSGAVELDFTSAVDLGEVRELAEMKPTALPKNEFYVIVDRLTFRREDQARLVESIARAQQASIKYNRDLLDGQSAVLTTEGRRLLLCERTSCTNCGFDFPEVTASLFSFNSPVGACAKCNGFGNILSIDETKVIPNPRLSLAEGAIKPFAMPSGRRDHAAMLKFCRKNRISVDKPWAELPEKHRQTLWNGTEEFYGIKGVFEYLETKKYKMHVRVFLARHKSPVVCPTCRGSRLRPQADQVLVQGHSITELTAKTIGELRQWMSELPLARHEQELCAEILRQIRARLEFLEKVGVRYLTLQRATKTLSGGEYQRLNLANQLGMGLSQTLYVLDEPTVGLHPRDNDRLIQVLHELRDLGNTLVIVEHDHDVIEAANHVVEMGPGSGHLGGQVLFSGDRESFFAFEGSNTTPYLRPRGPTLPREPRPVEIEAHRHAIELTGCRGHNLKNIDVKFPLHRLVTVTGVSGSGKSTLVSGTLYPALARLLEVEFLPCHDFGAIDGYQKIKQLLFIDQSRIGQNARSSPVTYLKVFDDIRRIMASTPDAKALGYTAGTFSLNVDGGRCPVCRGLGVEMVDMVFMDDLEIRCDACDGRKYRAPILDVRFKGKNIYDILTMTVAEAMEFFVAFPAIRKPLSTLKEVGLDYLALGQSANSLSGGESQRLKIAKAFESATQKGTLYILDEPTTGLHFREVHLLLRALHKLVEAGGSVILIEHNLEVIRLSDYVIDLGPEAGAGGGQIMAQGPPEAIARSSRGHTGRYLREYMERHLGAAKAEGIGRTSRPRSAPSSRNAE